LDVLKLTYDGWEASVGRRYGSRDFLLAAGVEQLNQKEKKNKVHCEEEEKNDVLGQCVVCLEKVRTYVFVPCVLTFAYG